MWSMMRSAADFEMPNSGASCRSVFGSPVGGDQQDAALKRQAPVLALADRVRPLAAATR